MSMLDSEIRRQVAEAFAGQLQTGQLRRETPGDLDEFGDPTSPTVDTHSFEGTRESFDARYRAQAGIPDTDVKILVIAGSTSASPRQGDQVRIRGQWHEVRRITEVDPAGATYTLQCYEIEDPT